MRIKDSIDKTVIPMNGTIKPTDKTRIPLNDTINPSSSTVNSIVDKSKRKSSVKSDVLIVDNLKPVSSKPDITGPDVLPVVLGPLLINISDLPEVPIGINDVILMYLATISFISFTFYLFHLYFIYFSFVIAYRASHVCCHSFVFVVLMPC